VKATRNADEWGRRGFQGLPEPMAVLDEGGNIVLVNHAWTHFAHHDGAPVLIGSAVGINYLEVCRRAAADANDDGATPLEGIVSVLKGAAPHFRHEYTCHGPADQRWFLMTATRLEGHGGGTIITHRDMTPDRAAEQARRRPELETAPANKAKSDFLATPGPETLTPTKRGKGPAAVCQSCPSLSSGLCCDFSAEEQERYFQASSRQSVTRDHALVRQGEPSRHVHSVVSGGLVVSRLAADGRRFVTDFIWPGEAIGLFAEERSAFSAFAMESTVICRHGQRPFESLVENSPRLAHRLFVRKHDELSVAQEHALLLGCASARARAAHFLLRLQERQGRLDSKMSPRVDLPMRRADIAAHLSLTVETLSRIFQDFVRKKYIVSVPDGVRILARETLVAISEDGPENERPP
jgi:CRP/FNR family transcriptional regulator